MAIRKRKRKKPQLNEFERVALRNSSKAYKEILKYLGENDIKEDLKSLLKDKKHSEFISPRLKIINSARNIALNKKYEIMADSVKVHHLQTTKDGSRTTQYRRRKKAQEKRDEEVFTYPEEVQTEKEQETYRILFSKHIASGMPKSLAQELTLRDFKK